MQIVETDHGNYDFASMTATGICFIVLGKLKNTEKRNKKVYCDANLI